MNVSATASSSKTLDMGIDVDLILGSAIVVVAKCPIPGSSKTRLSDLLGFEGSASLADSLLRDVLTCISSYRPFANIRKVLLYAPGNDDGLRIMSELLTSIDNDEQEGRLGGGTDTNAASTLPMVESWTLLPMLSSSYPSKQLLSGDSKGSSNNDIQQQHQHRCLRSSSLGDKLKDALIRVRQLLVEDQEKNKNEGSRETHGCVAFLGMDCPEIDLNELHGALLAAALSSSSLSSTEPAAHLCPADDGGYGMLCVPPTAPPEIFDGVLWSHPLTAVSQLKAMGDAGVRNLRVGKVMSDVDEPHDVWMLAERLCRAWNAREDRQKNSYKSDALHRGSFEGLVRTNCREDDLVARPPYCKYTFFRLIQLGLIVEDEIVGRGDCRDSSSENIKYTVLSRNDKIVEAQGKS